jgi:hypothetical protein
MFFLLVSSRCNLDYLLRVLNNFYAEKLCNFIQTLCLYCFVLEKTGVIMFFVTRENFTEIFEVIWHKEGNHDDSKQMVV